MFVVGLILMWNKQRGNFQLNFKWTNWEIAQTVGISGGFRCYKKVHFLKLYIMQIPFVTWICFKDRPTEAGRRYQFNCFLNWMLQFEWAWQHPVESRAVRQAAASFKSLGGVANKIKLAYTMLTLPEWQRYEIYCSAFLRWTYKP